VLYTCIVAKLFVGEVCVHIELHGNNFERSNKEHKIKKGEGNKFVRAIKPC
jgi:hypothetical protein